jgi:hypothetical protein
MNEDSLSLTMFWVGVLFAFTPILVVAVVVGTTWYLRKKRRTGDAAPH